MQDAASVHQILCKHGVHPSCPGQGVADKAADLGTARPHAVPPRQTHRPGGAPATPPSFSGRSGARSCFPSSGIFKQLLPAPGRWHQSRGWSPGLGSVGKGCREARDGEAGASQIQSGQPKRDGGRMDEWTEGWLAGWRDERTGTNTSSSLRHHRAPTRLRPSVSIPATSLAGLSDLHLAAVSHHGPPPQPRITPAAAARSRRRPARPQRAG